MSLAGSRRLLVASDGVLELLEARESPSKMERLAGLLAEAPNIDSLVAAMGIDPKSHYPDDVTLLFAERSSLDA